MPESDAERERRATDLAFAQGRREAVVDARLDSHEARLSAINGSIEKHARNAEALRQSIDALRDQMEGISATLTTKSAIEADRSLQLQQLRDRQIGSRQFNVGVSTVVVTMLGLIVTVLIAVHVI